MNFTEIFQNLVAFTYSLEMVNLNRSLLGDIQLGAVVFDDCGNKERAQERLLSFLSSSDSMKINPKSLIAMVTFSDQISHEVDDILNNNKITHLTAPVIKSNKLTSPSLRSSPTKKYELNAIVDLIRDYGWSLINVIYADEDERNMFLQQSLKYKICIENLIALNEEMTVDEVKSKLRKISDKSDSKIVVVLGREKINAMILKASTQYILKK